MVANQRMIASDGKEVMLFPLPYMYISQGENESYSHAGILAIDFLGYDQNGRVYNAPMYAPCSCTCVAIIDATNNGRVFVSNDTVHTPLGLQRVTFMCFHDDNPIAHVGDSFVQGQLFAHTGTAGNVSGDHTHFNTASGTYAGWENVPPDNNGELVNSESVYRICYVNDTVLVNDYNYGWLEYNGSLFPDIKFKGFPWVLYINRIRDKRT